MARQRLGVVLLIPQPLATEIDGRAVPSVTRRDPHRSAHHAGVAGQRRRAGPAPRLHRRPHRRVDDRAAHVADRAGGHLRAGEPVAYLRVGGEPRTLEALEQLRTMCLEGPLERSSESPSASSSRTSRSPTSCPSPASRRPLRCCPTSRCRRPSTGSTCSPSCPAGSGRPIADAPLGERPSVVGRGSLPLELTVSGRPDVEAAALLSFEEASAGTPFAVTARRDDEVVAAGWGWSARGGLEVADLVVAPEHRGQGIGRHVLAAVVALASGASARWWARRRPWTAPGAALLAAAGFASVSQGEDASTSRGPAGGSARLDRSDSRRPALPPVGSTLTRWVPAVTHRAPTAARTRGDWGGGRCCWSSDSSLRSTPSARACRWVTPASRWPPRPRWRVTRTSR